MVSEPAIQVTGALVAKLSPHDYKANEIASIGPNSALGCQDVADGWLTEPGSIRFGAELVPRCISGQIWLSADRRHRSMSQDGRFGPRRGPPGDARGLGDADHRRGAPDRRAR